MSDSLRAIVGVSLDAYLTKDAAASPASNSDNNGNKRSFTNYSESGKILDGSTYPPVTKAVDLSVTLAATEQDFDLTAAPLAEDINRTVNLNGLKLIAIVIQCAEDNDPAGITIGPHPSSNPYAPWGASTSPKFYRNERAERYIGPSTDNTFAAGTPAVDGTHKNLRISGAIGDAVSILALFG